MALTRSDCGTRVYRPSSYNEDADFLQACVLQPIPCPAVSPMRKYAFQFMWFWALWSSSTQSKERRSFHCVMSITLACAQPCTCDCPELYKPATGLSALPRLRQVWLRRTWVSNRMVGISKHGRAAQLGEEPWPHFQANRRILVAPRVQGLLAVR